MRDDVTVVIPTIPPRESLLLRALASVGVQTRPAAAISIAVDVDREGAWATRHRALMAARTEWVAFLDDDDEFWPEHLADLVAFALETGADYAYSWFTIHDQLGRPRLDGDPFPPGHFLDPWDNDKPRQTTITTLVRTELAQQIGFHAPDEGVLVGGERHGEDYTFTLRCMAAGAKIVHLPKRTWIWHHHGRNTSGLPDRW